ncbi:MAG: SRPBCC family protein [Planctomycetaceae bacterium]
MTAIDISPIEREPDHWKLRSEIWLPQSVESVFDFFADATNLQILTPPWLHFRILTPQPFEIGEGSLIDYRLRLRFVPIRWRSEISDWNPPHRFVDRQIRGPYREWTHLHTFEAKDGGTLVRDDVTYSVPGGRLVHDWLVGPDLQRIFAYRHDVLAKRFSRGDVRLHSIEDDLA